MFDLTGKTALITGASAGIGAATAEAFARAGARLIICARRQETLEAVADHLRTEHNADVYTFTLDVRDAHAAEAALSNLPDAWQTIDILVNNAGLAKSMDKAYENTVDDIDTMVDTNVKGLLYVTRAAVPGMVARERGHIINIGSTAGRAAYAGGVVYCATKHALTAGLKVDLHGTPIRVSTVDPGMVETDFSLVRFDGDATRADAIYANTTPLTAEDVADAVLYCATRPAHVNISEVLLMSIDQSSATLIHRRPSA